MANKKTEELAIIKLNSKEIFSTFPEFNKNIVLSLFDEVKKSRRKDIILTNYLELVKVKVNSKGGLLWEYIPIYEKLFNSLYDKDIKKKYVKILIKTYSLRYSHREGFYKVKLNSLKEFLAEFKEFLPKKFLKSLEKERLINLIKRKLFG